MYRKALACMVAGYLALGVYIGVGSDEAVMTAQAIPVKTASTGAEVITHAESSMEVLYSYDSKERVVGYQVLEPPEELWVYTLSKEDHEMLLRIVEAEAGSEDEEGKLLVANVVLNRMNHEQFPDTVTEVVLQRSETVTQFSPVANGSIWSVEISQETVSAVERALQGEDLSQGALYFAARKHADSSKMRWFDRKLTYLFTHGGHEFFL